MTYFSLIVFAVLPSIVWLLYFLRKDKNPEPKKLLLLVFLAGGCFAVIAYFIQTAVLPSIDTAIYYFGEFPLLIFLFYHFAVISFSEEFMKYVTFLFTMRGNVELDEPIDFVVYMITIAMGFAALENFIYLYSLNTSTEMAQLATARFISATLLHAIASGFLGIFLVYGYRFSSKLVIIIGLIVATIIHGVYNIILYEIAIKGEASYTPLALFLIALFLILAVGISKVKNMKSICIDD